jgi:hypothetical protein
MAQRTTKWSATMQPVPRPERLRDDDRAYHRKIVAGVVETRGAALLAQDRADHWWAHIKETYDLAEEDTLDPEGIITRAPAAPTESPTGIHAAGEAEG